MNLITIREEPPTTQIDVILENDSTARSILYGMCFAQYDIGKRNAKEEIAKVCMCTILSKFTSDLVGMQRWLCAILNHNKTTTKLKVV